MNVRSHLLALSTLVLLTACHSAVATYPELKDPDDRVVIGFLAHYQNHDIDGMMNDLADDAQFHGSNAVLNKQQIKAFLEASLKKHPNLRVEYGPPQRIQDGIEVQVKLEADLITRATWLFVIKNNKINSYSIKPGTP